MTPGTDLLIPDFQYRVGSRIGAVCSVHVKTDGKRTAVLLVELPENHGMSVTNASETIATEVLSRLRLSDDPASVEWYEWYQDGSGPLARVRYDWDGRRARNPRWEFVRPEDTPFPELAAKSA